MTDELCDVQNDAHITQQELREHPSHNVRSGARPTSADNKLELDELEAIGKVLRGYLADPAWILFPRHEHSNCSELRRAQVNDDGSITVDVVERKTFQPPRRMSYVDCEFIGEDLIVRKEWDSDKPKE